MGGSSTLCSLQLVLISRERKKEREPRYHLILQIGMEENELTSIACSERKRKMQDEQLETPSPKQICRHGLSNRVKFANKGESDPESTNSNSFDSSSSYSFMTNDNEDKTACGFQETRTCDEAFTSVDGFSSQNRLSLNTSTRGQESLSINENQDPYADIGFYTDEDLKNLLYSNGVGPSSGFVLSSGRWAINEGAEVKQEGKKKLTIDKEFEQHFSMLMM